MSKKSFVMYQSWASAIEKMSDEQAGQLLKAIYALQEDPDAEPEDDTLAFVFAIIKEKMIEDQEAYEETCRRRADSGKKGGIAKAGKSKQKVANLANASKSKQKVANLADTESDTDTDILLSENINTPLIPPQGGRKFSPPSIEEVKAYCSEHNYAVDPEEFVDFYTSKGWKVGKNPMKDWKAAVRTWARRDKTDKQPNRFHNFEQRNNTGVGDMLRRKQITAVMKGG